MSINIGQRILASVEQASLARIETIAGGFRLVFGVRIHMNEWNWSDEGSFVVNFPHAEAQLRQPAMGLPVGHVLRPAFLTPRGGGAGSATIEVAYELSPQAVEEIETSRGGSGIRGHIVLPFSICTANGGLPGSFDIPAAVDVGHTSASFEVQDTQWSEALDRAGYYRTVLVVLKLPRKSDSPELQHVVEEVDRAFAAFKRGDYRDTLAKCRVAIEALEQSCESELKPEAAADLAEAPRKMEVNQRFQLLSYATKMITHVGAHAGPRGKEIARDDAQLVLTTTANLVRVAPGRLSRRPSNEDE